MSIDRITERVLARIRPDKLQLAAAERFRKRIQANLDLLGIKATAMIGGSTAKGTFLKGDHDVDLFIRFDYKTYAERNDELSDLLQKAVPEGAERIHGSRDYFQYEERGLLYELVPVLKITAAAEAKNVTDVSPLHVDYVLRHVKGEKGLRDEIRLVKQFCKAAKVYGAESYLNGFSGHVLDLLIIRYGGFERLLRAAVAWGESIVIDLETHHKRPEFSLDKSKRLGPAIIVDPIQPGRNAAAALSAEKYERFKEAARAFLAEPSLKAFTFEPATPTRIKEAYAKRTFLEKTRLLILRSKPQEGKDDVVATKLLKIHEFIGRWLLRNDFTLLDQEFEYVKRRKEALHVFIVKEERLPVEKEMAGPPVKERRDAKRFLEKHKKAYERNGRLYVKRRRAYRTPLQALEAALKEEYVIGRCASIRRA